MLIFFLQSEPKEKKMNSYSTIKISPLSPLIPPPLQSAGMKKNSVYFFLVFLQASGIILNILSASYPPSPKKTTQKKNKKQKQETNTHIKTNKQKKEN